jgi:hypothetical protein
MTYQVAYNTTDGPLVIDVDGRVLGSREFGPVDTTDGTAKQHLAAERLVQPDKPGKDPQPGVKAAYTEADRLNVRVAELQMASKQALTEAARTAGLIGEQDTPTVTELVRLLTRTDVIVPTSEPAEPAKES